MLKRLIGSTRFLVLLCIIAFVFALYNSVRFYNTLFHADVIGSLKYALKAKIHALTSKPLCPGCNVILVSLDTLSANHLPCYGYGRNTAPALCAFARENIIFDHAYANAHFTLPSHVSIFTGLLPSAHGVNEVNSDSLPSAAPFLPALLQNRGYETEFVMPTNDPHLPIGMVYNRGISSIIGSQKDGIFYWQQGLQKLKTNEKAHKKTFLFLHTYAVHGPYLLEAGEKPLYTNSSYEDIPSDDKMFSTCSKEFIAYVEKSLKQDLINGFWQKKQSDYQKLYDDLTTSKDPYTVCRNNPYLIVSYRFNYFYTTATINTPEKVEYIKALYDQKIRDLDEKLKYLFDFVSQPEIKNNTILIITADHGEEFMEHGEVQHNTLYDSNLRVPLIVYIPGVRRKEIGALAQGIDLTPSILDLTGTKYDPLNFQGQSLADFISGGQDEERYVIAERMYDGLKTIRNETYKLFLTKDNASMGTLVPYELYDTNQDPGEKHNLIYTKPEAVKLLKDKLLDLLIR